MNDLERRAMLGDRQAQEECTRRGIMLPCPKCYGPVFVVESYQSISIFEKTLGMQFECAKCGLKIKLTQHYTYGRESCILTHTDPLAQWNDRHAPPIGRCGECANACNPGDNIVTCGIFERDMMPDDFCSQFVPKGGEENG